MIDEDLAEAVGEIPHGDVDSIAQYDDGAGHFVIHSDPESQDVDQIDEVLEDAGYERDGHLPVPGMTQQNFKPINDD